MLIFIILNLFLIIKNGKLANTMYQPFVLNIKTATTTKSLSSTIITSTPYAQIFYPFGFSNNDTRAPKADDVNSGPITFKYRKTFPYLDTQYSSVYINANGLISFNDMTGYLWLTRLNRITSSRKIPILAAFWSDISTFECGNLYYRETMQTGILRLISNDIQKSFKCSFQATWAFIVTFDKVCQSGKTTKITNSFQIVITTDDNTSYAIYNYGQLSWFEESGSSAFYSIGDGVRFSILPGSLSSDILKLSVISNVGIPGKWIFNVSTSSSTIWERIYDFIDTTPKTTLATKTAILTTVEEKSSSENFMKSFRLVLLMSIISILLIRICKKKSNNNNQISRINVTIPTTENIIPRPQNSLIRPESLPTYEQINLEYRDENRVARFNLVRQTSVDESAPPAYSNVVMN